MLRAYFLAMSAWMLSGPIFAQSGGKIQPDLSTDTTTLYGKLNYVYANLNKTPITTGILREYGIDLVNPDNYTGTLLTDSNWTNMIDWRMLYATIASGKITSAAAFPSIGSIDTTVNSYTDFSLPITIATLHYFYDDFDSSAVANNLISINNSTGQLNDVTGRMQSPYKIHSAFAIAPTRMVVFQGSNQMIFRSQLFLTNTGKTISTIQVDPLGTGTYQSASMDVPFTVNYTDTGIYSIIVKITYTDGSIYTGHSKVVVYLQDTTEGLAMNYVPEIDKGTGPPQLANAISYGTNYTGPYYIAARKPFKGQVGSGDYTVVLSVHNTDHYVKKPLIVIDGFDPEASGNSVEGQTYIRFLLRNLNKDMNQIPPTAIPLNTPPNGLDDGDSLDLVYLHWNSGTDYIERNAYVLESLIQSIDSIKASHGDTTKNIIMGFSMGGLVARYALRDMERYGIDHQTRLFISHDAPYWGANVPVSLQLMVQHLAPMQIINGFSYKDLIPQLHGPDTLFSTPAAKEMLIQRYILNSSGIPGVTQVTYSISADNSTHTNFLDTLNAMGWPVNCRNVAFANGACSGQQQFSGSNVQLVNISGESSVNNFALMLASNIIPVFGPLASSGIPSRYTIPASPLALIAQYALSPVTTKGTLNLDFHASSIPSTGTAQIYQGDFWIHRQLFFGLFNVTSYIVKCRVNSTSDMLPLDGAQGGKYSFSFFGLTADSIQHALNQSVINWAKASIPIDTFCFVPTVSSLSVSNPSANLVSNICSNLNCLVPAQIADYYAAPRNQIHVTYTADNSNWILKQIPWGYGCDKICPSSMSFVGSDTAFCTSGSWSLTGLPSGATVNWTTGTSGIVNLSCSPCTTVGATKVNTGTTMLTASFPNTCGTSVPNKSEELIVGPVVVGTYSAYPYGPTNAPLPTTPEPISSNVGYLVYNGQVSNLTSATWSYSGSPAPATFYSYPTSFQMEVEHSGVLYVTVTGTHMCGTATGTYPFFSQISGGEMDVMVSPNPASDNLTITARSSQTTTSRTTDAMGTASSSTHAAGQNPPVPVSIARVKIFSATGVLQADLTYSTPLPQVQINTKGLVSGVYFVEIISSDYKMETQKVVIQH